MEQSSRKLKIILTWDWPSQMICAGLNRSVKQQQKPAQHSASSDATSISAPKRCDATTGIYLSSQISTGVWCCHLGLFCTARDWPVGENTGDNEQDSSPMTTAQEKRGAWRKCWKTSIFLLFKNGERSSGWPYSSKWRKIFFQPYLLRTTWIPRNIKSATNTKYKDHITKDLVDKLKQNMKVLPNSSNKEPFVLHQNHWLITQPVD